MRKSTMNNFIWMSALFCFSNNIFAQHITFTPRLIRTLPTHLKESSGIITQSPNRIWSMNDGGNEPTLYQVDTLGNVLKTVRITNQPNIDWEEICLDVQGNLYIGDFGNNFEMRRDLAIYKVLNFNNLGNNVAASRIAFKYEDQIAFPPSLPQLYFDAEAMLAFSDSIYIFTKDFLTKPYTGATRIYSIPNREGNHVAKLVHILPTDAGWKFYGAVTGAAMSPDKSKVVLLSYGRLFVFSNFNGTAFWKGRVKKYNIANVLQYEGISFVDNCQLYVTCETESTNPASLYSINLCQLLSETEIIEAKGALIKAYPNPSDSLVTIELSDDLNTKDLKLQVTDPVGKTIFRKKIAAGERKIILPSDLFLTNGLYFYAIYSEEDDFNFSDKIVIQK
jgi:Secretion system C-terminal sorting domain